MEIKVLPLHEHWERLQDCCNLINSEWKRSETARLRSLRASCDKLPTSLILLKAQKLIGHLKISPIPSIRNGCFIETVVIDQVERGNGFGTILMRKAEEYCKENLKLGVIFLSTKGQEGFYNKLGYIECQPISIYGSFSLAGKTNLVSKNNLDTNVISILSNGNNNVPTAPPMPNINNKHLSISKTYMKKEL
ncbi:N-alpha-acetyltransferase 80 [Euwallacea fornicatus]|uniref:N-alpha-acetyltransferase 80 n=1 Tax=Euwallacea fornicatus TaxID=995702 RepID=UPI00338E615A